VKAATEIRVSFSRECLRPRHDAVSVLTRLRSHGLFLGLVSDCSAEVPAIWHETPLAEHFDAAVFSCVVGTKKPDPRMYREAYERLTVLPERCLYVGDGFSQELDGARRLGMHPVLIKVPCEVSDDSPHNEASSWNGDRISSLTEVIPLAAGNGS